jgi:peptide/nickel transport system ATP-binding protein
MAVALLEIRDLRTTFRAAGGEARAVDGVSLSRDAGRTLGLVGESGCGKTMTALSIMRLVPPPGAITAGIIEVAERNLLELSERGMRAVRGAEVAMIFQEPMTSLNPVLTIGDQITEAIRLHRGGGRSAARAQAIEMLRTVEIPEPERRVDDYPHQLSGGMRRRGMLSLVRSCRPDRLVADEPTTSLEVVVQAQILDLLGALQRRFGMALLLVTHDFGVVAERADEVAIMYAGRVVERGAVADVFRTPLHPYTQGLLRSIPRVGAARRRRLEAIPGVVPDLFSSRAAAAFATAARRRSPPARRSTRRLRSTPRTTGPRASGSAHNEAGPPIPARRGAPWRARAAQRAAPVDVHRWRRSMAPRSGRPPGGHGRAAARPYKLVALMNPPLLEVRDLSKRFPVRRGLLRRETAAVRAVDGVSFDLAACETLGIVGETGCGKTTLGASSCV